MYWQHKKPSDNAWHPISSPTTSPLVPTWLRGFDSQALVVDAAPFVVATGAAVHLSQINRFGFTAYASPFRNPRTIAATHAAATFWVTVVTGLQLGGVNYRQYIPRWAGSFEPLRDETAVRQHIRFGMNVGFVVLLARFHFGKGPIPSMMDVVIGGATADLLMREYFRAHTMW